MAAKNTAAAANTGHPERNPALPNCPTLYVSIQADWDRPLWALRRVSACADTLHRRRSRKVGEGQPSAAGSTAEQLHRL